MAPKSIFPRSPLSLDAIKLGRLVLSTRDPHQDYIDPSTDRESLKFTKSLLHDFEEIRSSARASGLRARLTSLLSMKFENRDDYLVDFAAAKSFTYLLENSKTWFARACGNTESRTWLNNAIENDRNVYLVVGYHTLVDARITERARQSEGGELQTGVRVTSGTPGVELNFDVGAASGQGHRFQRKFDVPGEQVYAVQYRKVKFNWYSSRNVETAFLEPNNRWKPCLGVRGEVSTGVDDVVEVEIDEGEEDEDEEDEEDEEDDEDENEDEHEDEDEDEEDEDKEEKGVRPVGGKSNKATEKYVTEKYVTESGGMEFVF